jgi:antitoxin HicB
MRTIGALQDGAGCRLSPSLSGENFLTRWAFACSTRGSRVDLLKRGAYLVFPVRALIDAPTLSVSIDRHSCDRNVTNARASELTENYSFSIILEPQEEGGFTVLVPALPEIVTEGDTEQEALANAEEAIRAIVSYRRDHGISIPSDARPEIRRVTVAA